MTLFKVCLIEVLFTVNVGKEIWDLFTVCLIKVLFYSKYG